MSTAQEEVWKGISTGKTRATRAVKKPSRPRQEGGRELTHTHRD